jgi:cysteinyl-tRNA synthetase
VYFDTLAFDASPKHYYAKLVHEAFGDSESAEKHLKESEGELSLGVDKLQVGVSRFFVSSANNM